VIYHLTTCCCKINEEEEGFLARHLEGAGKIILKTSDFTIKKFLISAGQLISYARLPKQPLWCMKSQPIKIQD
jgi:hypothetical protein